MEHRLSCFLTHLFYSKGWIDEIQKEWFTYRIEIISNFTFFLISIFAYSLLFNCLFDVLLFLTPMILLRKYSGGWHAKTPLQCYVISISLVVLVTRILGPYIIQIPVRNIIPLTLTISIALYLEPPTYPAQLHFDSTVIKLNFQKKQRMIQMLILFQIFVGIMGWKSVLVYTCLAEIVCLLSLKKEGKIMKSRKSIGKCIGKYLSGPYNWPPTCVGLFYQPERPILRSHKSEGHDKRDSHQEQKRTCK